jgi:hypothetical protein
MRKADIAIGAVYAVKVSGRLTAVKILRASPRSGWIGINQRTGREVPIRTAARLRREYDSDSTTGSTGNRDGNEKAPNRKAGGFVRGANSVLPVNPSSVQLRSWQQQFNRLAQGSARGRKGRDY